jgi:hypothetical protein
MAKFLRSNEKYLSKLRNINSRTSNVTAGSWICLHFYIKFAAKKEGRKEEVKERAI